MSVISTSCSLPVRNAYLSLLICAAFTAPAHAGFSVDFETLTASQPSVKSKPMDVRDLPSLDGGATVASAPVAAPVVAIAPAPAPVAAPVVAAPVAPLAEPKPDETVTMKPIEHWMLSPADGTMRAVLGKWASRAGWQLSWEATVDVPLTVSASFQGDFRSAVKQLFGSLSASEVNLTGLLYTGNRVLRVTEIGQRTQ